MSQIIQIYQIDVAKSLVINKFNFLNDTYIVYPDLHPHDIKKGIKMSLAGTRNSYRGFKWVYSTEIDKVGLEQYLKNVKPKNLLVDLYPEIAKEWDHELNIDIDLYSISYGSEQKTWWKCLKNSEHKSYKTSPNNRTYENEGNRKPTGCPTCHEERLQAGRPYKPREKKSEVKKDDIGIGDTTEDHIKNIIEETGLFNVNKIGNDGGQTDIKVIISENNIRSIQVKTLTRSTKKNKNGERVAFDDKYSFANEKKYDPQMLIVAINKEGTRFALDFYKNLLAVQISLPFDSKKSKYKNIMYTDKELFVKKLIELIPESVQYTGFVGSHTTQKEHESFERIKIWCHNNGLQYERNMTNKNTIDILINGIPLQAKYSGVPKFQTKTYSIHAQKYAGYDEKGDIYEPYSENEPFEYIICEIGGLRIAGSEHIYKGKFCLVPKSVLIERGIFKSPKSKGLKQFRVCPPDYKKDHWSKSYWLSKKLTPEQKKIFESKQKSEVVNVN